MQWEANLALSRCQAQLQLHSLVAELLEQVLPRRLELQELLELELVQLEQALVNNSPTHLQVVLEVWE